MSDVTAERSDHLNLADVVARIERQQAETRKFVAEHEKLSAEREKLAAEREKLAAEASKMIRERAWFPVQVGIAFMAAGGALVAGAIALVRVLGL